MQNYLLYASILVTALCAMGIMIVGAIAITFLKEAISDYKTRGKVNDNIKMVLIGASLLLLTLISSGLVLVYHLMWS